MGYIIRMPQLGMQMERGQVVEWTVDEGAEIPEGETVAIVESEKTQADVDAREDGILGRIIVEPGTEVEPGDPIGIAISPGEDVATYEDRIDGSGMPVENDDTGGGSRATSSPGTTSAATGGNGDRGAGTDGSSGRATGGSEVRATPGARKLAEERGVDLTRIDGTGLDGAITDEDVAAVLGGAADASVWDETSVTSEVKPLSGMQETIATRLGESYRAAVHVTLNRSFDSALLTRTVESARTRGAEVSIGDLLVKAVGVALDGHPEFNAVFTDGEHRMIEEINVNVAVDTERGLLTPVISDVVGKSAEEINDRRRDLADRVRAGDYSRHDLEGGTFTVSNLGGLGIDHFDPIINPPQIAILGVGRIRADGSMTLSLSFDHRVVNGADAARFLDTLVETLTDGERLVAFFDADVPLPQGRNEEQREIHVASSGFSGTYEVAGLDGGIQFDEPPDVGGTGRAPTPVEHLLGALGSCLALAFRAVAERDGIHAGNVDCDVVGTPDDGPLERIEAVLVIESEAPDTAIENGVLKAKRSCYVERTLTDRLDVSVDWKRG